METPLFCALTLPMQHLHLYMGDTVKDKKKLERLLCFILNKNKIPEPTS